MPEPLRYVRRSLQPNETIVHAARLHWRVYIRAAVFLCFTIALAIAAVSVAGQHASIALALWIAAALVLLLALSAGLQAFVRRATTEFAITDHRVIYKTGLLRRHTLEMNRGKVESVDVDQTILGRILGYGTIVVRGTGGSLEPIRDIAEPLVFRRRLTAAE
jgi:uncharacterized membrane protein YdbT with pleckstrin-like domain